LALAGLSGPAAADDAACRAPQPIFSVPDKLERIASRLRRHEPIRILAIGSSSTEGTGASSPTFSYPAQLQADLTEIWKEKVTVRNAGKGGETVIETVGRLEAALRTDRPDLVIWQVGTNDAIKGGDEGRFAVLLKQGIDAAQEAGVEMLLLDQQYYPAIKDLARYERFVNMVGTTAATEQVPVFSRYRLMKGWSEHSADVLRSMLSGDGFHMGDRGYDCIAQLIATGLHSLVAVTGAAPGSALTAAARR
jgi:lysophospholipase L1-like esterase